MNRFQSSPSFTPAARRVVDRCRQLVEGQTSADVWTAHLILALLQDESLASACLREWGITQEWLASGGLGSSVAQAAAVETSGGDVCESPENVPAYCGSPRPAGELLSMAQVPDEFLQILERAAAISRQDCAEEGVSSSHLLRAVVEISRLLQLALRQLGVTSDSLSWRTSDEFHQELPSLAVDCTLQLREDDVSRHVRQPGSASGGTACASSGCEGGGSQGGEVIVRSSDPRACSAAAPRIWRLLDACLNRAREGVRVLEDYARFVLDDADISRQLKNLRHALVSAERRLLDSAASGTSDAVPPRLTVLHRNTAADVGTTLSTAQETRRQSGQDVLLANSRRLQEALRSLEEFGKLVSPEFAAMIKQLRYQAYQLEAALLNRSAEAPAGDVQRMPAVADPATSGAIDEERAAWRRQRLQSAQLYALLTESSCRQPWQQFVEAILTAGVDVIQLREKHLADGELLRRARWLADACRAAGALSIINDRPDVAILANADGVHVGQEELPAAAARNMIGPARLLGLSTHELNQVQAAVAAGADYLGTGPVFPSSTKSFADFPGLPFVRDVVRLAPPVPWFAIGGVQLQNLPELLAAGARRVAVTAALSAAVDPAAAVGQLRTVLLQGQPGGSSGLQEWS